MKLSQEKKASLKWKSLDVLYVLISILLALIAGGLFILVTGNNPFEAYGIMFSKAFSSFGQVLRRATVYILTGLAVSIPIKTGVINMGGEGQVAAGALTAAVLGSAFMLPLGIHPIVCMLGAMITGALLAMIPAVFKTRFGSSEVVTGIMVNYLVQYLLQYLSMYTFRGSDNSAQTAEVLDTAKIPRVGGEQWSYGLFIAIAMCLLMHFVMGRTRVGLEMRSAGLNPLAARYQGVNVGRMSILAMVLGGAMAGLGGSLEVLGGRYLYMDTYFANYGFDGIAVSYMAKNNPVMIVVTALFISVLKVGAVALDRQTNVSVHFSTALQGIFIILLVSPYIVQAIVEKLKPKRKTPLAADE